MDLTHSQDEVLRENVLGYMPQHKKISDIYDRKSLEDLHNEETLPANCRPAGFASHPDLILLQKRRVDGAAELQEKYDAQKRKLFIKLIYLKMYGTKTINYKNGTTSRRIHTPAKVRKKYWTPHTKAMVSAMKDLKKNPHKYADDDYDDLERRDKWKHRVYINDPAPLPAAAGAKAGLELLANANGIITLHGHEPLGYGLPTNQVPQLSMSMSTIVTTYLHSGDLRT